MSPCSVVLLEVLELNEQKINLDIADIQLKETEERLSLEAKMARSDYQLSIENYQTAKKNLDLAEKIEKKQRIKFVEGISSSFDLTQAQNQLYSQQQTFIQSMLDVIAKKSSTRKCIKHPTKIIHHENDLLTTYHHIDIGILF